MRGLLYFMFQNKTETLPLVFFYYRRSITIQPFPGRFLVLRSSATQRMAFYSCDVSVHCSLSFLISVK